MIFRCFHQSKSSGLYRQAWSSDYEGFASSRSFDFVYILHHPFRLRAIPFLYTCIQGCIVFFTMIFCRSSPFCCAFRRVFLIENLRVCMLRQQARSHHWNQNVFFVTKLSWFLISTSINFVKPRYKIFCLAFRFIASSYQLIALSRLIRDVTTRVCRCRWRYRDNPVSGVGNNAYLIE